jgi:hypothetical protein
MVGSALAASANDGDNRQQTRGFLRMDMISNLTCLECKALLRSLICSGA